MNLLDKAISDVKLRKSKKKQTDNQESSDNQVTPSNQSISNNQTISNTTILTEGERLSRDAQYISDYTVETPIHLDENAYNVINTYRGSYQNVAIQLDGGKDENGNSYIYKTIVSPSLFNPYYGINSSGISPGVPLLDNIANKTHISATAPGKDKDRQINKDINLTPLDDCSINNLVRLSNEENSILGQARYKYSDFMYCRDVGKISNNHLITLRRFSAPVRDNIFQHTGTDTLTSNETAGDIGRLITWFGTPENKLEDILKYSFHATWKEMEAARQDLDSQENDPARGLTGGLVNLMNNKHAEGFERGIHASAFKQLLDDDASEYDTGPYADNPAVNGRMYDKHKIYEPKDTIRSKYMYDGSLKFSQEFTLTFNYKLRGYDNINGKTAMLDLLGNILAVTYKKGKFWPGEQHIIGAPQNKQGWAKAQAMQNTVISASDTFIGKLCNGGTLADAASSAMNIIQGADLVGDLKQTAKDLLGKLKAGGLQSIFSGLMKNALGRPAVYAFDSLLSEGETGTWHVTIGNPLNPIASIGNLIIDGDVEITHSGPLGLDDFPTEITVKVPLKHAMPRDSVDIQKMFTKGRKGIYIETVPFMTNPSNSEKYASTDGMESTSAALKTSNTNIDLKDKASPIQFTAFSYFGDTNIERIKANSDSLGQR